jgi:hypothetical protein
MRAIVLSATIVLVLVSSTAIARGTSSSPSAPKATTLILDSFTLSAETTYTTDDFWCSFNNYAAFFPSYTGQCPSNDYVASLHWKKVASATEYDVCLESFFRDRTPGFACWIIEAPKSGSPASLTMTFDSAAMSLNAYQGTTQVWIVQACAYDSVTHTGPCSQSNTVAQDIPWTG